MTKSKTTKTEKKAAPAKPAKKAASEKVNAKKPAAPAKKAPVKAAVKAPVKTPMKATKPVKSEKTAKPVKTAKPSKDTDVVAAPAKQQPRQSAAGGFSNAGLGVKTAGKKPALSVAPGVMTLGRSVQPKQDLVSRPSDRRLSKKELADIKNFLLEKRERLLAGMRRELALQKERATSKAADDVDKATDAYDEDLSFEIATANDQELSDIRIALEKIEKNTYGECEVCGCGISPSRLKILPSATTCVACRGQEELTRRRDDGQQLFNMMEDGEGEAEPI